jgi:hypothetical protein
METVLKDGQRRKCLNFVEMYYPSYLIVDALLFGVA